MSLLTTIEVSPSILYVVVNSLFWRLLLLPVGPK